jgi:hypothetical protein
LNPTRLKTLRKHCAGQTLHLLVCNGGSFAAEVEADIQEQSWQSGARSRSGLVVQKPGRTKFIVAEELDFL